MMLEHLLRFIARHVSLPPRRNRRMYAVYDYGGIAHFSPQHDVAAVDARIAESDYYKSVYMHALKKHNYVLVAWLYTEPPRSALTLLVPRPWCYMRLCGQERGWVCRSEDGNIVTAWGGWWLAVSYPPSYTVRRAKFISITPWERP
ncbi:MAG: hypothetical protein QXI07_09570 [Pyrobaculum sp.]